MNVLCFDIATGGLTAALFNEKLEASRVIEKPWRIRLQPDGAAVLPVSVFEQAIFGIAAGIPADAIAFSAFMHSLVAVGDAGRPLTPIFTWMDTRGTGEVERIRAEFGGDFHRRTGCRFHPMFPVFKLAALRIPGVRRIAGAKAFAIAMLTGNWIEDHGTASATGFYNIGKADWDDDILRCIGVDRSSFLTLVERDRIVGYVTGEASSRFGVREGTPVVAGSGDGFLANLGSGCEDPSRFAATLGTSASVRQILPCAVFDETPGAFCYRATMNSFLLGCAGSNGGNVLDWARSTLGGLPTAQAKRIDLPAFIPHLHGERSPEWNPLLTARWEGVTAQHTRADLAHAVLDGVVFNLAHYCEILSAVSGRAPSQVVLSGNGFRAPLTASTLASVLDAQVLQPPDQGLASLRGAAICGFRALGVDVSAAPLLQSSKTVEPDNADEVRFRYRRYREFRSSGRSIK